MTRRRRSILACTLAAAAVAFAVPAALNARQGTVTATDGRVFAGEVTEQPDAVVIDRSGIQVTLPREQVKGVDYGSFADKFAERLDALNKKSPKDISARVALAREAFDEKEYDLALRALDSARAIDPGNKQVADLTTAIRSQRRLGQGAENPPPPAPPRDVNGAAPGGVAPPEPKEYVTDAQVNRIRQAELQPNDRTVHVRFLNGVDRKYVETANIPFRDFRQQGQAEQALAVLSGASDEVRDSVQIATDPRALADFRRVVQPALLAGCATSTCHGSAAGGKLILFNETSERATYSNFYVLSTYKQKVGDEEKGSIFSGPKVQAMFDPRPARPVAAAELRFAGERRDLPAPQGRNLHRHLPRPHRPALPRDRRVDGQDPQADRPGLRHRLHPPPAAALPPPPPPPPRSRRGSQYGL